MNARSRRPLALLAAALLVSCASPPASDPELPPKAVKVDTALPQLLAYAPSLSNMSLQEMQRERNALAAAAQTPATQLRLALLLGQPRGPADLSRALALLEGVLKSRDPAAASLQPLARTLATQYQERLKIETQNEKLLQQLRDSQRRVGELQEKLDALSDIEHSLPPRPGSSRKPSGVAP